MLDYSRRYEATVNIKGKPVYEYAHNDGNIYIEGRKGSEYGLTFHNRTPSRVLVIPAVDGLSVMDGKPAGYDSDGYVVDPYQPLTIPGWRINESEVAKFEFGAVRNSYAKQSGQDASNVGVIGFMVFEEYKQPPVWNSAVYRGTSNSLSASSATASSWDTPIGSSLGTEFGDPMDFQTVGVNFTRKNHSIPDAVMVFYYDDVRGLEKRGIDVKNARKAYTLSTPDPFPKYKSDGCSPPPGWTR